MCELFYDLISSAGDKKETGLRSIQRALFLVVIDNNCAGEGVTETSVFVIDL